MAKDSTTKNDTDTVDSESTRTTSTSTESAQQQVYCVFDEGGTISYLPLSEARVIIERQQKRINSFTTRLTELDSNAELIKQYFNKSTDVNKQLLYRYRKLLDWILKGGIAMLLLSLLLIAIPLIMFIYKFNNNESLDSLKTVLWWMVGLYGLINIGGLITWGLATFGFKKQLDNLEKRTDRIEDKFFK